MRFISRNSFIAFSGLALASLVCVGLAAARLVRTGSLGPLFLVWNLILAWAPFVAACAAYRLHRSRAPGWLAGPGLAACGAVWLLFFPNAPYLLTDLIHLQVEANALLWYDLLMLLWFGWTGLSLGMASLYLVHQVVTSLGGRVAGWLFALATLCLASFGVYLGRFLRWNSWDVLTEPFALFADIYSHFRHPLAHFQSHVFWMILAGFLILAYVMMLTLTPLQAERPASR